MSGVSRQLSSEASSSLVISNTSRTLKRFKEGAGDLGAGLRGPSAERLVALISARIGCIASGEKMVAIFILMHDVDGGASAKVGAGRVQCMCVSVTRRLCHF